MKSGEKVFINVCKSENVSYFLMIIIPNLTQLTNLCDFEASSLPVLLLLDNGDHQISLVKVL